MFEYNLTNNMPCPTTKIYHYTNLLQMKATRMQMSTILPNTDEIGGGGGGGGGVQIHTREVQVYLKITQ
jgi:hypothetical protein